MDQISGNIFAWPGDPSGCTSGRAPGPRAGDLGSNIGSGENFSLYLRSVLLTLLVKTSMSSFSYGDYHIPRASNCCANPICGMYHMEYML